jgi:hypothetical protein
MSYNYAEERPHLFTEEGQVRFVRIRDKALAAIRTHGAFRLQEMQIVSWEDIACIDRMVELRELVEFKRDSWGQYRVFTTPHTFYNL